MSAREPAAPHTAIAAEVRAALRALPPFSAVAIQLQVLADEDLCIADTAEMIKADAALSADVLRLANSPLFGIRQTVSGVLHAIAMLGLNRVKTLVITAALRSFGNPARGTAALERCWRHNLACALICEDLADKVCLDPDAAYTAGLLHDIGRCGMLGVWTARYCRLLDEGARDSLSMLTLERRELGIDHAAAGGFLLRDWRLPELLIRVAELHHHTPQPGAADFVGMVHCACGLADRMGFAASPRNSADDVAVDVPQPWRDILGGLPEEFAFGVAERINSLESYLLP
jgi:putative nucleotidyltransferase with HDIG domain